jgi:hypothetical protein
MADAQASSGSIISAVSGDAEPVFGVEEIAAQNGESGETAPAEGETGGEVIEPAPAEGHALESVETAHDAGGISGMDDIESFFSDDDEPAADEGGEEEEMPEELADASERAQRRFRALSSRVKEAETQNQQWKEWAQSAQQKHGAMQAQFQKQAHQMQMQMVRMQERLAAFEQGYRPQQQEELDPAEAFRQKLIDEGVQKASEKLSPEMQALKQEIEGIRRERDEAQQRFARERRKFEINTAANEAAGEYLTNGFPDEFGDLNDPLGTLAVAWAHGRGIGIPDAARELKGILTRWGLGHLRARAATKGQKVRSSQTKSSPPRGNRPHANGKGAVSYADAKKAGYANPLKAMFAQGG